MRPRQVSGSAARPASEGDDDLAEDLAALDAGEALLEFGEGEHRIDHRLHAAGHLLQGLGDVLDATAEGTGNPVLLLEKLHQVDRRRGAGGRPAGDQPAAALEAE